MTALDEIRRNGIRAAALVEQLLAFARQQPQRQQVLDLVPLVDGLRPLLAQLLGKGIVLAIEGATVGAGGAAPIRGRSNRSSSIWPSMPATR